MFCKKCGKEIADDSIYCQFCGANQKEEKPTETQVNIEATPSKDINYKETVIDGIEVVYPKYVCSACGSYSNSKTTVTTGGESYLDKVSFRMFSDIGILIGVIGLFFYVIPGVIILLLTVIAKLCKKSSVPPKVEVVTCSKCKATDTLIPIDTPNGKAIFEKAHPNYAQEYVEKRKAYIKEVNEANAEDEDNMLWKVLIFLVIAVVLIGSFIFACGKGII